MPDPHDPAHASAPLTSMDVRAVAKAATTSTFSAASQDDLEFRWMHQLVSHQGRVQRVHVPRLRRDLPPDAQKH